MGIFFLFFKEIYLFGYFLVAHTNRRKKSVVFQMMETTDLVLCKGLKLSVAHTSLNNEI